MLIRRSFIFTVCLIVLIFSTAFGQQADLKTNARELFQKGDYKNAIKILQKAAKQNAADADAWNLLGFSFLKTSKLKEAAKAFDKTLSFAPANSEAHVGKAYVYLLQNEDWKAAAEARKASELDPKNAEAFYLAGVVSLRNTSFEAAYKSAEKALQANPQFSEAYLLKSEALAQSASKMYGVVLKTPDEPVKLLNEAMENLKIYLKLAPNAEDVAKRREDLDDLKFLADYYAERANAQNLPDASVTPLKILNQPRPGYTEAARRAGITGTVRLHVIFAADGRVRYPLIISGLSHGLNEQALIALRQIKFEPAMKNGKPISTVRVVEYRFSMY